MLGVTTSILGSENRDDTAGLVGGTIHRHLMGIFRSLFRTLTLRCPRETQVGKNKSTNRKGSKEECSWTTLGVGRSESRLIKATKNQKLE